MILARTLLAFGLLAGSAIPPAIAAPAAKVDNSAKFTLDHLIFTGNQLVDTPTLTAAAKLQPGDKIDRDDIVAAFGAVQQVYGDKGMGVMIQPEITYPKIMHMDLTFAVSGETMPTHTTIAPRLDRETIAGNVKVSSAALAPAMTMKPGDEVTDAKIVADEQAIGAVYKKLGLAVDVQAATAKASATTVDVAYTINENPKPKK